MPDHPSPETLSSHRTLWLAGTAIGLVLAGLLFFLGSGDRSPCLILAATGVSCPGCGMTRAAAAMLHGDWTSMWRFHPLAPFVALEAVFVWALWGWTVFTRKRTVDESLLFRLLVANTVLLVAVWLVRFVNGTLPG